MQVAQCHTARRVTTLWAWLCFGLVSSITNAQSHEGRSLQLNTGTGGVLRGDYRTRVGWAADAMFSAPITNSIRWGLAGSVQGGFPTGDDCIRLIPNGACLTSQQLIASGTVLIGRVWQLGSESSTWSFRTYAGPSVVRVYVREGNPYRWITMGGATGRIEVVKHVASHLDLFVMLRGALIPALPKDARGTHGFGFGIGLH